MASACKRGHVHITRDMTCMQAKKTLLAVLVTLPRLESQSVVTMDNMSPLFALSI